ncbi:PP2C family protein-serine/threonine phosphatase [Streptomyces sp. NPDC015127]|uniref:PP2C family protein-serine/threonine phosphatase n=1 Tax=Streptomyces sp. NPDC015127 TaxID=3364939 RepID=UPI00370115EC
MIRIRSGGLRSAVVARARPVLPWVPAAAWGVAALAWRIGWAPDGPLSLERRIVTGIVFFTVGAGLLLGIRRSHRRELRRVREVADAAQHVLLHPPPPRLDGLTVAARQISASRHATVGGDLYEALATPFGVRVVIGDVRGHGLPAIGAVAAVLGSFREAAHDEPEIGGVLRRLERAVQRYLRDRARDEHPSSGAGEPESPAAEEFVTVLLVEIAADGGVRALNCGHPWPYRLCGTAEPLTAAAPLPPLGAFPLPDELPVRCCDPLRPGEALFLHTDGASDARDARGRFFALEEALARAARAAPLAPAAVIARVHGELLRHTGGRAADDIALLVLRNDRARVPAQASEALRRTRPEPSHR